MYPSCTAIYIIFGMIAAAAAAAADDDDDNDDDDGGDLVKSLLCQMHATLHMNELVQSEKPHTMSCFLFIVHRSLFVVPSIATPLTIAYLLLPKMPAVCTFAPITLSPLPLPTSYLRLNHFHPFFQGVGDPNPDAIKILPSHRYGLISLFS
jgi:hypothetical protein